MKVVYSRNNPVDRMPVMAERNIKEIAVTLSYTNREAFIITRSCPFSYLNRLRDYGVSATAKAVIKNRRIVGYKFKNVS